MSISRFSALASSALLLASAAALVACGEAREREAALTFEEDIGPLLAARCARCHGAEEAAAGYRVEGYLDTIGCLADGRAATLSGGEGGAAPLLAALEREDHVGLLSADERAALARWLEAGAPARTGFIHPPGIVDPRSPDWHGLRATEDNARRLRDGDDAESCGRCHAGAPTGPAGARPLERATACTACHDEPGGVLACDTCHGDAGRPQPPRDACFFAAGPRAGSHSAHLELAPQALGLTCATCHPEPTPDRVLSGAHIDGVLDVAVTLPTGLAWEPVVWDSAGKTCAGGCHDRGGEHTAVQWGDSSGLTCQSCHLSPPDRPDHPIGECDQCHGEVASDGMGLTSLSQHLNGRIDLGDGGEECHACHGDGRSPWPMTGAHSTHRAPTLIDPVDCETCHPVPQRVEFTGAHGNGVVNVELRFERLVIWAPATYDPEQGSCSGGCHDRGGARADIAWTERGPLDCQSCHGAPPAAHPPGPCARCHQSVTPGGDGLTSTERHLNGRIDLGDASGGCGACHGSGGDPWPTTGSHPAHKAPLDSAPIPCEVCHIVPATVDAAGHLDSAEGAEVVFSGIALGENTPGFDGSACAETACHSRPGARVPLPRWGEEIALKCDSCHGAPPAPPHSTLTTCQSLLCHGGEVVQRSDGPGISASGRPLHVNGAVDVEGRQE